MTIFLFESEPRVEVDVMQQGFRYVILMVVGWLMGCTRDPLVLYLPNATPEEHAATEAALARLNPYAKPGRAITFASTAKAASYTVTFVDTLVTKDGPMLGRECTKEGTDCPVARSIRVLRGLDTDLLVHVIAHEIGHAWQIPHLPPRAMMAAGTGGASHFFTALDQPVCEDKGECSKTPAAPPPLPLDAPGAKVSVDRQID